MLTRLRKDYPVIEQGYKYRFLSIEAMQEAERTLRLAMVAAEGLYGESRVRMDAHYVTDESICTIAVDASTDVGQDVAAIFTIFVTKLFGQNRFLVRPVEQEVQE